MKLEIGKDYKTHGGWRATAVYEQNGKIWCIHHNGNSIPSLGIDAPKDLKEHFKYGDYCKGIRTGGQGKYSWDIISEWVEPVLPIKLEFNTTWSKNFETGIIYPVLQKEDLEKFIGLKAKVTIEEIV